MGLFDKLKQGLQRTKDLLQTDVRDLFKPGELLTEEVLEQFEARLIQTDLGVSAADEIVSELREKHLGRTVVVDEIWETVKHGLRTLLKGDDDIHWDVNNPLSPLNLAASGPTVILVAGVNGVGKTTSISKLAKLIQDAGKTVILAAGILNPQRGKQRFGSGSVSAYEVNVSVYQSKPTTRRRWFRRQAVGLD